ncbi:histidine phosphatase superfamily [Aspergillus alliaceus]|uniref:Histidine phosphatase superfamily n=1 Tax=Petromyces alliaceus TaxID=209559 RepID=A0A5N7CHE4_PETAA|nr:histidine phosphatase superfamily [Aspergillus alliaceus]
MVQLMNPQIALAAILAATRDGPSSTSLASVAAATGAQYSSTFDLTSSWANLSPYKPADGFGVPRGVPRGCELSQVHILHRHAERYPESPWFDGGGIRSFSEKLQTYNYNHDISLGAGALEFLKDWKYILGQDILLATGAATEVLSGADTWSKYGRMLYRAPPGMAVWDPELNVYPNGTQRLKPVFRTTNKQRVLESARWWLTGFFGHSDANKSFELVVIPEGDGVNNTLAAEHSCPGDLKEGTHASEEFIPRMIKHPLARLSKLFPEDFNLTTSDVLAMMNLCPYEYATLGSSSFCELFTEQEWRDFAYNLDMRLYGASAFGSPTGRAQGIGYILELAARLEGKLIQSSDTSINTTYDNNSTTFPVDQPLYMDMTHDKVIIGTLTALGIQYFNHGPKGMPSAVAHAVPRTFELNKVAPFGGRLVSEVWTCPMDASLEVLDRTLYKNPDLSEAKHTIDYIRFVLNGAPLPTSDVIGCENAKNGFCKVANVLRAVPKLKEKAMYQEACYKNYTPGHQVGDGRPEI